MNICILSPYESKARKVYHTIKQYTDKHTYVLALVDNFIFPEKPDTDIIVVICEKTPRKAFDYYYSLGETARTSFWIFMSDNYSMDDKKAMVKAGNISFVFYDSPISMLKGVIEISLESGQYYDPGYNGKKMQDIADYLYEKYHITQKEYNVIKELVDGKNAKEIGDLFGLSPTTIETHRKNIYKKMGIHKILQLAQIINELDF